MRNILFVLIAFALVACEPQPSQTFQAQDAVTASESATQVERNVWPPLSGDEVPLSDNVLANNYYILLDNSGSMESGECAGGQTRFKAAQDAIIHFSKNIPAEDNVAFAVFSGNGAVTVTPFGAGNSHREQLARDVQSQREGGGTPLEGSLNHSFDEITQQAKRQLGYGTYRLIVLTDGEASGDPGGTAQKIVSRSTVEIHVIGFCTGSSHSLNVPGYTQFYTADDPEALANGLASVQAEVEDFSVTDFSVN